MTPVKTISSRHNPLVTRFREVADRRESSNLILLDGEHLLQEALAAGLPVRDVVVSAQSGASPAVGRLVAAAQGRGAVIYEVTEPVMRAISPVRTPSGVVCIAEHAAWTMEAAFKGPAPLVVGAVDVQDPGNVGAIVRAAEAGGATGVLLAGASADPFSWKAIRGSMGSSLRLPVVAVGTGEAVREARSRGARIAATIPRGGLSLFQANLKGSVLLLLGSEGPGLPDAIVQDADERITIPMRPPVESLNVAVAAALLVYEAARQRR